jgi:hypothetical protein
MAFPSIPRETQTFLGIEWGRVNLINQYGMGRAKYVHIPAAYICGACLILPGLWCVFALKRRQRNLRQRAHQCVDCGYDLRATPQRCPECGSVPDNS